MMESMILATEWEMLDYERLDASQRSIEFVALAAQAVGELPAGQGGVRDPFRRAAMSIPLNIAEASGRVGSAVRARFHGIARGSAMACGALLDVLRVLQRMEDERYRSAKALLERIVAMLTRMCRKAPAPSSSAS
jgi:four helix bundle protein